MTRGTSIRKDHGPKGHDPAGLQDTGLPWASRAHDGWKCGGIWIVYDWDVLSTTNIAHMDLDRRSSPLSVVSQYL